ncbi:hypothetical protein [Paraflavitalea pollutisoli]|uniref:hypothetical protein n=1 Tax=Paraflavitalea pollutisoli TaxID=3034143 RepID=UPI0023EB2350|nr:hypothetical protein [Paraflavitalea sp. H1-2-19X]
MKHSIPIIRLLPALLALLAVEDTLAQSRQSADTMGIRKNDTLQTVTVTGRKPMIERRTDRIILPVESMMASAGGTAWEVPSARNSGEERNRLGD